MMSVIQHNKYLSDSNGCINQGVAVIVFCSHLFTNHNRPCFLELVNSFKTCRHPADIWRHLLAKNVSTGPQLSNLLSIPSGRFQAICPVRHMKFIIFFSSKIFKSLNMITDHCCFYLVSLTLLDGHSYQDFFPLHFR